MMAKRRALPPRMRLSHGRYFYDHGYTDGRRHWQPLSRDLAEAKVQWARIEAEGLQLVPGTFAAAVARYKAEALGRLSAKEQSERARYLERALEAFGHMPLDQIRAHHLQRAHALFEHANAANKWVTAVSAVFTHTIRTTGALAENPCKYVKLHTIPARERCPSLEEFRAVVAHAAPVLAEAMVWAVLTGWDLGQIIHWRVDQQTEEGVRYKRRKTAKQPRAQWRVLSWSEDLRACYARLLALHPHPWCSHVVVTRRGTAYTENGFKSAFRRAMRTAEGRGVERFWFRDLRALAATIAEEQGNDAQALLAHLDPRQTVDYIRSKRAVTVRANRNPLGKV